MSNGNLLLRPDWGQNQTNIGNPLWTNLTLAVNTKTANDDVMKRTKNTRLRPEYDFAAMQGGVRGKYTKRYREGTNIVLLEPDIAEAFPNDAAVNQALRGVLNTTRAVRGTGGLAEKSLQTSGQRRARRSRRA
jgi:hypothetical protein